MPIHNSMNKQARYAKVNIKRGGGQTVSATSFDWSLVRSFLVTLEQGSLLAAGRTLGMSQPTLGRHIAELERQLGVVLFERTGRGLLPTEAAGRLAESARAMQAGADSLARSVAGSREDLRGTVRLSASEAVASTLLPPVLAQMRRSLPEIQIEVVASNAVSNLLRREADIALRMIRPAQGALVARRIGTVTFGAFAHEDYLRRRGTPREPADLLHHDLIGDDRNRDILTGFHALDLAVTPEHFALRTDHFGVYWQAVRAGLGVGFLAHHLARADPRLLQVLPSLPLPTLPVWLVVHRELRTSQRVRAVFDFLASAVPPAL